MLKEIQQSIKNNLLLIISLLNIQDIGNQHVNIKEFIEKAGTRISSMALMDQRLYKMNIHHKN